MCQFIIIFTFSFSFCPDFVYILFFFCNNFFCVQIQNNFVGDFCVDSFQLSVRFHCLGTVGCLICIFKNVRTQFSVVNYFFALLLLKKPTILHMEPFIFACSWIHHHAIFTSNFVFIKSHLNKMLECFFHPVFFVGSFVNIF